MKKSVSEIKKAVAIKYPDGASVPFITAKGKGELAEKILLEAKKNNIKIEEDAALVEILSAEEIGQAIPESAWKAVAQILSFVLQTKDK